MKGYSGKNLYEQMVDMSHNIDLKLVENFREIDSKFKK